MNFWCISLAIVIGMSMYRIVWELFFYAGKKLKSKDNKVLEERMCKFENKLEMIATVIEKQQKERKEPIGFKTTTIES